MVALIGEWIGRTTLKREGVEINKIEDILKAIGNHVILYREKETERARERGRGRELYGNALHKCYRLSNKNLSDRNEKPPVKLLMFREFQKMSQTI